MKAGAAPVRAPARAPAAGWATGFARALLRLPQSWVAPGRVFRALRGVSESRLLAILMLALLVSFVSQLPGHARAARLDPAIDLDARIGGSALAVLFLMPLLAYGLAQLVAAMSRLTPWRLAPTDSRLALFWALLAVSPAMLLVGAVAGQAGSGPALTAARALAGLGFAVIWLAGLATLSTSGKGA